MLNSLGKIEKTAHHFVANHTEICSFYHCCKIFSFEGFGMGWGVSQGISKAVNIPFEIYRNL